MRPSIVKSSLDLRADRGALAGGHVVGASMAARAEVGRRWLAGGHCARRRSCHDGRIPGRIGAAVGTCLPGQPLSFAGQMFAGQHSPVPDVRRPASSPVPDPAASWLAVVPVSPGSLLLLSFVLFLKFLLLL